MKTPSDQLYRLVKSLDVNEKRYLTIYTNQLQQRRFTKTYRKLLLELEQMEVYDETALQAAVHADSPEQFKRMKHYAFETTLRSLENFHATGTPETIILRKFMQTEILLRKKQFDALRRSVEQAYRLCLEHDKLLFLPVCIDWQLRIGLLEPRSKKNAEVKQNDITKTLGQIEKWMRIRRYNVASWKLLNREGDPTAAELKQVKLWIADIRKTVNETGLEYTLMREYCQTLSSCYRLLDDWKNSLRYRLLIASAMEAEPKQLINRSFEYITVLNNIFVACMNLQQGGTERYIEKATRFYQRIPTRKRTARVNDTYINLLNNQVAYLLKQHAGGQAYTQCQTIQKTIIRQDYRFSNSIVTIFFTNYTVAAMYTGNYREALKHHHTLRSYRTRFDTETELLGLVIYYELGEYDLLLYRARSFRKQLKKNAPADRYADTIAAALTSPLLHTAARSSRAEGFRKLQAALEPPAIRKNTNLLNSTFSFSSWIAAQVSRSGKNK